MNLLGRSLIALLTLFIGLSAEAASDVDHLSGHGPIDGSQAVWTKLLANESQIKFYAKYPQLNQKIQFMVQNDGGTYEEVAWIRVEAEDLDESGGYKNLQNNVYLIRTLDLKPGKNRVRILIDGEVAWGTKTYSYDPASPLLANSKSPAEVGLCKVPDGRPSIYRGYPRGAVVGGVQVGSTTGFPMATGRFPVKDEANLIAAMVSFLDTDEFVEQPVEFLGDQVRQISEWSQFWSQGSFEYRFQIIENWIRLPINSWEATDNDELLARMILDEFPEDLDYESVDGTFIYWAPGLQDPVGSDHDFGIRVGSNEQPFVVGEKRPGLFWAPSSWHYQDGEGDLAIKYEMKRDFTWSYWVHELLHEQGLNLHAPGNGWATGLGSNHYPVQPENRFSGALSAWELFLMGWLQDSQVHCIEASTADSIDPFYLTSLEVGGGERKMAVILFEGQDEYLVVESRRPVGYSRWWDSEDSGLLVYEVNPALISQDDHSYGDCGNDPSYPKWSYYLFPDNEDRKPASWCGGFDVALVHEGESLTYKGLEISVTNSFVNVDEVRVRFLGD